MKITAHEKSTPLRRRLPTIFGQMLRTLCQIARKNDKSFMCTYHGVHLSQYMSCKLNSPVGHGIDNHSGVFTLCLFNV